VFQHAATHVDTCVCLLWEHKAQSQQSCGQGHCEILTATRFNTLHNTATNIYALTTEVDTPTWQSRHVECNTLQHAATHCSTLQQKCQGLLNVCFRCSVRCFNRLCLIYRFIQVSSTSLRGHFMCIRVWISVRAHTTIISIPVLMFLMQYTSGFRCWRTKRARYPIWGRSLIKNFGHVRDMVDF